MAMSIIKALEVIQVHHEDPRMALSPGFSGSPVPESHLGTAS